MRLTTTCFGMGLMGLLGVACGEVRGPSGEALEADSESGGSALTEATEVSTWLSDLPFVSASNGRGPVERDRSNGERAAGDGRVITLNGRTHAKGLGVHATSRVVVELGGKYQSFAASVGIDDEVGSRGTVAFRVIADGATLFNSGVMRGNSVTKEVNLSVAGRQRLELRVSDGGNGTDRDHADWASARLIAVVTPPPPPSQCQLGPNASLGGRQIFPLDNEWNRDVSGDPVDANSAAYIASIGPTAPLRPDFGRSYDGHPFGIPYVVVPGDQPRVPMAFDYEDESDPGPYPFPLDAPIEAVSEGDGDRHVIAVDCAGGRLYETYYTWSNLEMTGFDARSGAIFDLDSNAKRPPGWTSADAAGLPIFAGLVRHDEVVERGEIKHALRFTVSNTQRAYVAPASHWASTKTDPNLPPMGLRVRLKASFDIAGFPKDAQVILRALKTYGMFVADNGQNWFLSGAPSESWDEDALFTLRQVKGSDFEVVQMGAITRPATTSVPAPATFSPGR